MTENTNVKLGTFLGVFTPTILTILGVILYLRSGWLVGHMGLERALLIIILANAITLTTTLSFSSVATNTEVGIGGAYYIISRSLGLEIGGAVGLPLFLSQAFSVTLYAFGLAESLRFVWPGIPIQAAAFVIVLAVGGIAVLGAGLAMKTQLPVLGLVVISLIALGIGAFVKSGGTIPDTVPSGEISFWVAFAVFFPAVTGVMAGLGLSGDLKNPVKALPIGSIFAVMTGFVVYLIVPVLLVMGASSLLLQNDVMVWSKISVFGAWVILPGLFGAIFSSALGSMLSAPRTLQALSRDRLAPKSLGRETGDWKELVPGIITTIVIALGAVMLGDLNAVAPVVTMFFLTVYGIVNIVAAIESLSGDPSWRPRIRVPWPINLIGGIACIAVMFLINPLAGIAAIFIEIIIWLILSRKEQKARWGDARHGLYESLIRWALIRLARRPLSARNWRPHVLVFVPDPLEQLDLIRFGNWFSQGRGVVTVCELVVGDLAQIQDIRKQRKKIQKFLNKEGLVVFAEVNVVQDVVSGITNVAQANGIAELASNTVLLGWPKNHRRLAEFLVVMKQLEHLNKSFIIGRIKPKYLFPREGIKRTVHVWWGGLENNSELMLLLSFLLVNNPAWRGAFVKVITISKNKIEKQQTKECLKKLIAQIRIQATPKVIVKPPDTSIGDVIQKESANAEVVFFGLATPEDGKEEEYAARIDKLAGDLPTVFFVKNSNIFTGDLLEPTNKRSLKEIATDPAD